MDIWCQWATCVPSSLYLMYHDLQSVARRIYRQGSHRPRRSRQEDYDTLISHFTSLFFSWILQGQSFFCPLSCMFHRLEHTFHTQEHIFQPMEHTFRVIERKTYRRKAGNNNLYRQWCVPMDVLIHGVGRAEEIMRRFVWLLGIFVVILHPLLWPDRMATFVWWWNKQNLF